MPQPRPAYDLREFQADKCFLCGIRVRKGENRSDEHIFPKWLVNAAGIWNDKLTLLNETQIHYRSLVVPCCKSCNTQKLSKFEKQLEQAYRRGFAAFARLPATTLWLWCCKIAIGLFIRETSLASDRTKADARPIVDADLLQEFWTIHHVVQMLRLPFVVNFESLASLFVVKTHKYNDQRVNFDVFHPVYFHAASTPASPIRLDGFAIRFGPIGIIGLPDHGLFAQTEFQHLVAPFQRFPAHPLQFMELAVHAIYNHSLLREQPRYTSTLNKVPCAMRWDNPPAEDQPIWNAWNPEDYRQLLLSAWVRRKEDETLFQHLLPTSGSYTGTLLVNLEGLPNVLTPTGVPSKAATVFNWLDKHKDRWAAMPALFRNRLPLGQPVSEQVPQPSEPATDSSEANNA